MLSIINHALCHSTRKEHLDTIACHRAVNMGIPLNSAACRACYEVQLQQAFFVAPLSTRTFLSNRSAQAEVAGELLGRNGL